MELTEFILQRVADDEAVAQQVRAGDPHPYTRTADLWGTARPGLVAVCADEARVLAQCESARRIVQYAVGLGPPNGDGERSAQARAMRWVCYTMTLPYRDHPDFDPAWA